MEITSTSLSVRDGVAHIVFSVETPAASLAEGLKEQLAAAVRLQGLPSLETARWSGQDSDGFRVPAEAEVATPSTDPDMQVFLLPSETPGSEHYEEPAPPEVTAAKVDEPIQTSPSQAVAQASVPAPASEPADEDEPTTIREAGETYEAPREPAEELPNTPPPMDDGKPELPFVEVSRTGLHEGRKVVETKEGNEFTFCRRDDGVIVKFSNATGQEVARKVPDAPTASNAPAPNTMPEATPPPAKAGRDPDLARVAYAEQAGVPKPVHEAGTLREALIAAVAHVGREDAVAWVVERAEHIPGCDGASGDALTARLTRVLLTLPVGG